MPSKRIGAERKGSSRIVKPFLNALSRMREQERLRPDQLTERATGMLLERFGASEEPMEAAFAHASIGMMADHSHYFDGFALMLSLTQGVAAAVRKSSGPVTRIALEDRSASHSGTLWSEYPAYSGAPQIAVARELLRGLTEPDTQYDVAIVNNVPEGLVAGRDAALAVSLARATQALLSLSMETETVLDRATSAIRSVTGGGFSPAFAMASAVTGQTAFVLVDTGTRERIALEVNRSDLPGWAIIDTGAAASLRHSTERLAAVSARALSQLQEGGFPRLTSLRDLEHRDLERALEAISWRYRSIIQYLVTENGRVPKLVAAVRRRDWQMFGALLLMSHASKRADSRLITGRSDHVVRAAERMSIEGIYGAVQIGEHSGCVLVAGQPFSIPPFLDSFQDGFVQEFGQEPAATLL